MKPRWLWTVLVSLLVGIVVGYWQASRAVRQAIHQPVASFFSSQTSLTARLLDVSSHIETFESAGRQVVQPFGALKLKKVFSASDPNHPQVIKDDESTQKTDPRTP